jgi:hypothetical protein
MATKATRGDNDAFVARRPIAGGRATKATSPFRGVAMSPPAMH